MTTAKPHTHKPPVHKQAQAAPASLQAFQRSFGQFLRDPHHVKRPKGVPKRASDIYHSLLFSNVKEFLDTCFPVCQSMISPARWQRLCRVYFRDWHAHSPMFTDIPAEFVTFLQKAEHKQPLPAWFAELAHYEWIELAVDIHPANLADYIAIHTDESLAGANVADVLVTALHTGKLTLNPSLQNLHYRWPVHQLSPAFKTRKRVETYMLVYRDHAHEVRFMHINPMTSALLDFMAEKIAQAGTLDSHLLAAFAEVIHYPEPAQLHSFGMQLLTDLLDKSVLLVKK